MPKVTVNENITVTYADDKIQVNGKTFKATLFLNQSISYHYVILSQLIVTNTLQING